MLKKNYCPGLLLNVIILGLLITSCTDEPDESPLNGTWVTVDDSFYYTFNNGNFIMEYKNIPYYKGTYITDNEKLIMTVTHVNGEPLNNSSWVKTQIENGSTPLEHKWYTKNELNKLWVGSKFDVEFFTDETTYSINGNELTIGKVTYTRK